MYVYGEWEMFHRTAGGGHTAEVYLELKGILHDSELHDPSGSIGYYSIAECLFVIVQ